MAGGVPDTQSGIGHVSITSRSSQWALDRCIATAVYTEEEAVACINQQSADYQKLKGVSVDIDALALTAGLGYHPLAVSQAL